MVAGGGAPPVFDPAEHDLYAVAALVPALVVADRLGPDFAARVKGRDALGLQGPMSQSAS